MLGEFEFPSKLGLFEVTRQVIIGNEAIDANGHLNNTYYQTIYEQQRGLYMATLGITVVDEMRGRPRAIPILRDYAGRFVRELLPGNVVAVTTAAQDQVSHLKFIQHIANHDVHSAQHQCTVYMIDENRKPLRRIPERIRELINQANQRTPET